MLGGKYQDFQEVPRGCPQPLGHGLAFAWTLTLSITLSREACDFLLGSCPLPVCSLELLQRPCCPEVQCSLRPPCAPAGGWPAGWWCPGGPGAAPASGCAQRPGLRTEAAGGGAGARDGRGLDALSQFQQESQFLLQDQVFSGGPHVARAGMCKGHGKRRLPTSNQLRSPLELFCHAHLCKPQGCTLGQPCVWCGLPQL